MISSGIVGLGLRKDCNTFSVERLTLNDEVESLDDLHLVKNTLHCHCWLITT